MTINTNEKLLGGGIHHIAVRTTDLAASLRLYQDVALVLAGGWVDYADTKY